MRFSSVVLLSILSASASALCTARLLICLFLFLYIYKFSFQSDVLHDQENQHEHYPTL